MPEQGQNNRSSKGCSLLIWDSDGAALVGDWTVVLWKSFEENATSGSVSIPRLVETHAEYLRKRYLAWIYELGERRFKDQRVVDYLELRPGFSYWWMTLFAEKCNYSKSPQITDAIRLMAFEKWAADSSFDSIVLASANKNLAECLRSWCAKSGVLFEWRPIAKQFEHSSKVKRLYLSLPHPIQSLLSLARYSVLHWPLRSVGKEEWCQTEAKVTFFSYLFNLVPSATKEGQFESRYWAHLPAVLQREGCKTNWLHIYMKDAILPSAKKAADVLRQFNHTGRREQNHATLDSFLGISVIFRSLFDWMRMIWKGRRLERALSLSSGNGLDLWPLFAEEWRVSMSGQTAMNNALTLNLFESALKSLPKQRVGVYLQENQGWEFALIHAWKAAGHGSLIGTPHSTVRFWDLRYFLDARSYKRSGNNYIPLPDQIAFNGAAMLDAYRKGDYPAENMVEVEALRYLYLENSKVGTNFHLQSSSGFLRVLVLGEYLKSNTHHQLRLLEKAMPSLPENIAITVKPHPACPIQSSDYPGLKFEITMEPVSSLLTGCDVAYSSSMTSAAVDAFCFGVPVVSVLDPNTLNLSPLRGRDGVFFASTPEELANALTSAAIAQPRIEMGQQHFFTLDSTLPRWRSIINKQVGDVV
jgi:surface carbohydrate biosynthesis protein (TIGR04326 family)